MRLNFLAYKANERKRPNGWDRRIDPYEFEGHYMVFSARLHPYELPMPTGEDKTYAVAIMLDDCIQMLVPRPLFSPVVCGPDNLPASISPRPNLPFTDPSA